MKRIISPLFSTALLCLWVGAAQAQSFQPIFTKVVGTGSNISYFVLDFKDGTASPSFAFEYRYDGALTGGDVVDVLKADGDLTFTATDYGTPTARNRFFDSYTLGSHTQSDAVDTVGYWSFWTSATGQKQQWTFSEMNGADTTPVTSGLWMGFSWDANYTQDGTPQSTLSEPTTPQAAPEPSVFWAFGLGTGGMALLGMRARRSR